VVDRTVEKQLVDEPRPSTRLVPAPSVKPNARRLPRTRARA
jgi:hypothetical protein